MRLPEQPMDSLRLTGTFERFGLPARLDWHATDPTRTGRDVREQQRSLRGGAALRDDPRHPARRALTS